MRIVVLLMMVFAISKIDAMEDRNYELESQGAVVSLNNPFDELKQKSGESKEEWIDRVNNYLKEEDKKNKAKQEKRDRELAEAKRRNEEQKAKFDVIFQETKKKLDENSEVARKETEKNKNGLRILKIVGVAAGIFYYFAPENLIGNAIKNPWFHLGGLLGIGYIAYHDHKRFEANASGLPSAGKLSPFGWREEDENSCKIMKQKIDQWGAKPVFTKNIINKRLDGQIEEDQIDFWPIDVPFAQGLPTESNQDGVIIPDKHRAIQTSKSEVYKGSTTFFPFLNRKTVTMKVAVDTFVLKNENNETIHSESRTNGGTYKFGMKANHNPFFSYPTAYAIGGAVIAGCAAYLKTKKI